eukprot:gene6681-biopygen23916
MWRAPGNAVAALCTLGGRALVRNSTAWTEVAEAVGRCRELRNMRDYVRNAVHDTDLLGIITNRLAQCRTPPEQYGTVPNGPLGNGTPGRAREGGGGHPPPESARKSQLPPLRGRPPAPRLVEGGAGALM